MNGVTKISLRKTILSLTILSLFCWGVTSQTWFLECASTSLEGIRYILVLKNASFRRGDIVSIQGYETQYGGKKLLAKRVLGFPGDKIVSSKKGVRIESTRFKSQSVGSQAQVSKNLPLLKTTGKGEPLTPTSATIVPEGYVFVAGDHPRSFDSRYEEFGLVPQEKIWGRALFAW